MEILCRHFGGDIIDNILKSNLEGQYDNSSHLPHVVSVSEFDFSSSSASLSSFGDSNKNDSDESMSNSVFPGNDLEDNEDLQTKAKKRRRVVSL